MSGIGAPGGPKADGPAGSGLPGGSDPSMEDILASIRRILSEDENASPRPGEPARHEPEAEHRPPEVFNLDASMIVDEPPQPPKTLVPEPVIPERARPEVAIPEAARPEAARPEAARPEAASASPTRPESARPEVSRPEVSRPEPARPAPIRPETFRATPTEAEPPAASAQQVAISPQPGANVSPDTLVAPAAAAAAAMSIGSLRRTLDAERQPGTRGTGITVEEMVREEMRPLLKTWLDEHLAPIVERLVRAEIERVVGRSNS